MALKNLLGGLFGKVLEQGAAIADEFTLSKEEREEFRQKDEDRILKLQQAVEETVQARYAAVAGIIRAEMEHGDNFTKRARPSLVYTGLAMFVVQMLGSPWVDFTIPEQFIFTWGGVCGVWVLGRSIERVRKPKAGVVGAVVGAVTGGASLPEL